MVSALRLPQRAALVLTAVAVTLTVAGGALPWFGAVTQATACPAFNGCVRPSSIVPAGITVAVSALLWYFLMLVAVGHVRYFTGPASVHHKRVTAVYMTLAALVGATLTAAYCRYIVATGGPVTAAMVVWCAIAGAGMASSFSGRVR